MDNRIRSRAALEQAMGDLTGNEDLTKKGRPTPRCATAHRGQRAERNSRVESVDGRRDHLGPQLVRKGDEQRTVSSLECLSAVGRGSSR